MKFTSSGKVVIGILLTAVAVVAAHKYWYADHEHELYIPPDHTAVAPAQRPVARQVPPRPDLSRTYPIAEASTQPATRPSFTRKTPPGGAAGKLVDAAGNPINPNAYVPSKLIAAGVTVRDARNNNLAGLPFYFQDAHGKWVQSGNLDASGRAQFMIDSIRPVSVGVGFDRTPEQDPRLAATAKLVRGVSAAQIIATLQYDTRDDLTRWHLGKLEKLPVQDALQKPMPQGTRITIGTGKQAVEFTVDENGAVDGRKFAAAYQPDFRVTHPDYGTAAITRLPHASENIVLRVPLIAQSQDDPLLLQGVCVGPDGKPVEGVKVAVALPGTSGNIMQKAKSVLEFAVSGPDGKFRYRPIVPANWQNRLDGHLASGRSLDFTAVPENKQFLPFDGAIAPGSPATITLRKVDRQVTLSFKDADDQPISAAELDITQTDELGKPIFTAPPGWMPDSGTVALAFGDYTFKPRGGEYECILTLKADTPQQVALAPHAPVIIFSSVFDVTSRKPVPGALVLALDKRMQAFDSGRLTPETWQKITALKSPVKVEDLPEQLRAMVNVRKAVVSDDTGQFQLRPGSLFKADQWVQFIVLKENYFPVLSAIRAPGKIPNGAYEIYPLPTMPGAYLDLEFTPESGDLPPQYKGDPECDLHSAFDFELNLPGQDLPPLNVQAELPNKYAIGNRRLAIPADKSVAFIVLRSRVGLTMTPGDYASFHLPGGPVKLKPGEVQSVKLVRKQIIEPKFRIVAPDGKPTRPPKVLVQWLFNSGVAETVNTFSYEEGAFRVKCFKGEPVRLSLPYGEHEFIDFDFPPFESVSGVTEIKLTSEQYEKIKRKPRG